MSQTHHEAAASGHFTPSSVAGPSYAHPAHHPAYQYATPTSGMGENHSTPGGSPLAANHPNPTAHPVYQAMYPEPDLPIANISRIMKRSLPENAKIAKDAKECVQDCVSELISFVTSEASDKCGSEKRKTINGDDVLYAMRVLGFDNYEEVLRVYLSRYRMAQEQNPRARKRVAKPNKTTPADDAEEDDLEDDEEDELERVLKQEPVTESAAPIPPPPQPEVPERDAKLAMQNLLQD